MCFRRGARGGAGRENITHLFQRAETRLQAVKDDVLLQCLAATLGRDGFHVRGVDLVRGGQEIVEVGEH